MHMELAVNTGSASHRARGFKYSHVTSKLLEADSAFLDASLCNVDRGGDEKMNPDRPSWSRYLNRPSLLVTTHSSEVSLTSELEAMPSYLIKPREPTVLSHKEYHEISSTNLLLPLVVRLPFQNDKP